MLKLAFIYFRPEHENHPIFLAMCNRVTVQQYFYQRFHNFDFYDYCVILPDGFESADKFFADKILLNKEKCKFLNLKLDNSVQAYDVIEELQNSVSPKPSILGAYQPHGTEPVTLSKNKQVTQIFSYGKETLEAVGFRVLHEQPFRHHALVSFSLFDMATQKLLASKKVLTSDCIADNYLTVFLDNPVFRAAGKTFMASMVVLHAVENDEPALFANPVAVEYRWTENKQRRLGSLAFFAY